MPETFDNTPDAMMALHRHLTDFDYMTNGADAKSDADHERILQDAEAFAELLLDSLNITGMALVGDSIRIDVQPKSSAELEEWLVSKLSEPEVSENLD